MTTAGNGVDGVARNRTGAEPIDLWAGADADGQEARHRQGDLSVIPVGYRRSLPWFAGFPSHRTSDQAGGRGAPYGFLVVKGETVSWLPTVDLSRLLVTGEIVLGAVLIADRLRRRPPGQHATVTMGPGGWVSMKGGALAVRPHRRGGTKAGRNSAARPWWARALSAWPVTQ